MARSTERNRLAKWRCQHQVQLPRQASGLPASLQPEQPGTPFQPDTLTLPRLAAQAPCANGEFVRKAEPSCWVLVLHGNTQGSRMVRPPRIFFFSSYPRVIFFSSKNLFGFLPTWQMQQPPANWWTLAGKLLYLSHGKLIWAYKLWSNVVSWNKRKFHPRELIFWEFSFSERITSKEITLVNIKGDVTNVLGFSRI